MPKHLLKIEQEASKTPVIYYLENDCWHELCKINLLIKRNTENLLLNDLDVFLSKQDQQVYHHDSDSFSFSGSASGVAFEVKITGPSFDALRFECYFNKTDDVIQAGLLFIFPEVIVSQFENTKSEISDIYRWKTPFTYQQFSNTVFAIIPNIRIPRRNSIPNILRSEKTTMFCGLESEKSALDSSKFFSFYFILSKNNKPKTGIYKVIWRIWMLFLATRAEVSFAPMLSKIQLQNLVKKIELNLENPLIKLAEPLEKIYAEDACQIAYSLALFGQYTNNIRYTKFSQKIFRKLCADFFSKFSFDYTDGTVKFLQVPSISLQFLNIFNWLENNIDKQVKTSCLDYADFLCKIQKQGGFFPNVYNLEKKCVVGSSQNSGTAISALCLLKAYKISENKKYYNAAKRAANFLIRKFILTAELEKLNALEWQNTAELLCQLYKINKTRRHLVYGERALTLLSAFQQIWDPEFIEPECFGGFPEKYNSTDWNSCSSYLFFKTYFNYYLETKTMEYAYRGLISLHHVVKQISAPKSNKNKNVIVQKYSEAHCLQSIITAIQSFGNVFIDLKKLRAYNILGTKNVTLNKDLLGIYIAGFASDNSIPEIVCSNNTRITDVRKKGNDFNAEIIIN